MKFRGTLIVFGLALALGAYAYLHEVRGGRQRARDKAAAESLLGIDPKSATAIRIAHSGTLFELQQRNGAWWLVQPVPAPGDPRVIPAFLDSLASARREDEVGRGDLVKYGLDAPAAIIEIDAGGRTRKLALGHINPLQTLVYALVDDGSEVVLTTSSLLSFALANAFGWRDKRMIDVDPERIQRLSFRTPLNGALAIRRDAHAVWRVDGDVPWRVDPIRARSLVGALARLDAVGIADESKARLHEHGLDNRRLGAEVEVDGTVVGDLMIGFGDAPGAYFGIVPNKPEIFRVDGRIVDAWIELVRSPRDPKALPPFDPQVVTRVRVQSPEESFELRRLSALDWKITTSTRFDSTVALQTGAVDGMLADLAELEVAGFPDHQPASSAYEPASIHIELLAGDGIVSGLDIGSKDPRSMHLFARAPGEPAVFWLSPAAILKTPFDLERLKADEKPAPEGGERG